MREGIVTSIERVESSDEFVYNVKTGNHNYFADGILVHNCDDGNDPNKVESQLIRDKARKAFTDYKETRQNDPMLTAVVNVQQRTHELDISGTIDKEYPEFVQIVIPMEAEADEQIVFPLSGKVIERKAGDQMHPDRFPDKTISGLKRDERIWAGRYQQRPQALGGGLFKMRNWRLYNPRSLPPIRRTVLSLDCSFEDSDKNDFNALAVIAESMASKTVVLPSTYTDKDLGIERNHTVEAHDYYVINLWHERDDITGTETALQQFTADYPEARIKLIEKKANGPAIISRLKSTIPGITPINPLGSKEERASAIQPAQKRGDIYLPIGEAYIHTLEMMGLDSISLNDWWTINPPEHESDATHAPVDQWVKELIDEFTKFPKAANDDIVDAVDQAIIYMEANGHKDAESIVPVVTTNDPRERRAVTMQVDDRLRKQRDRGNVRF